MEDYTQGIPSVRTMPTALVTTANVHKRKTIIIVLIILVLLAGGFAAYWFFFRDTDKTTDQQKFAILEALKDSSINDFTPEQKEQALAGLEAQSNASNPGASSMTDEEKMDILNSLGQ